ncbi:MAG: exosortase A, partial [Candidatus Eisenbacteria bacterium]
MNRDGAPREWAVALPAFAVTLLAALLGYRQTVASLVNVWSHSDTFVYGFFVAPACIYLVWRSRDSLAPLWPRPYPLALIGLIPLGFAWLVGRAASTLLLEQVAFVAMVPVIAFAHFGPAVTRRLAFPLGFLFFSVPFGDFLQPKLMAITADFAEQALRWSGLTVAREGLYLILPNSRWQVLESCSGLRFTVAGAVLATLFAHLTYRSNVKRVAFIVSAIGVSIFANGVRAYVLILIGHLTQMRRGQGFDHYFYGWVVFTLLMTAWFMVGAAFRDREPGESPRNRAEVDSKPSSSVWKGRRVAVA